MCLGISKKKNQLFLNEIKFINTNGNKRTFKYFYTDFNIYEYS